MGWRSSSSSVIGKLEMEIRGHGRRRQGGRCSVPEVGENNQMKKGGKIILFYFLTNVIFGQPIVFFY